MPIPTSFDPNGVLAPGTYDATLQDIKNSILVNGNGNSPTWDKVWRKQLVDSASILINELWSVGIVDIFLDGSFVEEKDHPNDIDGYFDPHLSMLSVPDIVKYAKLISDLNILNKYKVWNWDHNSRRQAPGSHKLQLPMWIIYRVELYPHLDQGTGIKDAFGNNLKFPSAFRQSRNGFIQKGIVRVIK
ncbi:MAG: hypothetical protein JNM39_00310 [Bdellovibrionaceae bacterium]|nr:hypothetical protein [Pseudobdellovibrionaceae bacterium]